MNSTAQTMPSLHPFVNQSLSTRALPPQMIPMSKKTEEWWIHTINKLESIGIFQIFEKMQKLENFKIIEGKFILSHYEDTEGNEYRDLLDVLQDDSKASTLMRHYDITATLVRSMQDEYRNLPNEFKATAKGSHISNLKAKAKAEMYVNVIKEQVGEYVRKMMIDSGFDPDVDKFNSEEEQQQYMQQKEEMIQKFTPKDIVDPLDGDLRHISEDWVNLMIDIVRERFNLAHVNQEHFKDILAIEQTYRLFELSHNGYSERRLEPYLVYEQKTRSGIPTEDKDYMGFMDFMTLAEVSDRMSLLLSNKSLESLARKEYYDYQATANVKDIFGNKINYLNVDGFPQGQPYFQFNWMSQVNNLTNSPLRLFAGLNSQDLTQSWSLWTDTLCQVSQNYWKSFERVGLVTFLNPETNMPTKMMVDETVYLPPFFKSIEGNINTADIDDEDLINTVIWQYVPVMYYGHKITPLHHANLNKPLYVYGRLPFQGKSDLFNYGCKGPIVGYSSDHASFVDIIKPFQIAVNLPMNQFMMMLQEDILPFISFDVNQMVDREDWGGKDNFEKWLMAIKEYRAAMLDTRGENTGQASHQSGIQVHDIDITNRALGKLQMAIQIRDFGWAQVGFSNARVGDVEGINTATGVNEAMSKSYNQTGIYFSKMQDFERRCLNTSINWMQYVQSKQKDITLEAVQDEEQIQMLKLEGTDLLHVDFHVYVNSTRQDAMSLKFIKQFLMENNTGPETAFERGVAFMSNSPRAVLKVLKDAQERVQRNQDREYQLKQQELNNTQQMEERKFQENVRQFNKEQETTKEVAYIQAFGYANDIHSDENKDDIPDIVQFEKIQNDSLKIRVDAKNAKDAIQLKREEIASKERISKETLAQKDRQDARKIVQARILGDKSK